MHESHAYTETGYLPENFLPEFLDFVIWGHEHECLIDPTYNPEMNFHVMQPGSSVATSLMPGEAVPKHVAVLSVTGRDFKVETIRLKTVRPFVMKEIILSEEKEVRNLSKKGDNRSKLTQYLIRVVEGLIEQAKTEWLEAQDEVDPDEEIEIPLPLIRLRIEYSAPDGGTFECENPQRFSNRFVNKVANVNDVVQFYRKKAGSTRKAQNGADMPEESILAQLSIDSVKVEKLVREFLTAQSLTILPQNSFGDAVSQFVDKDDKHAMEMFVNESLSNQIKHLMDVDHMDEDDIMNAMDQQKSKLEELFAAGYIRKTRKAKLKPRPDTWDSDLDGGAWEDQPGALIHSDVEADEDEDEVASLPSTKTKGRGKATAPKKNATAAKKAAPAKKGRGKKTVVEEESEEEDSDVVMMDSDEDESQLFVKQAPAKQGAKITAPAKKSVSPVKRTATRAARNISARQMKLDFSQPMTQSSQVKTKGTNKKAHEVSEDEISDDDDDDDAFAPPPPNSKSTRSRR